MLKSIVDLNRFYFIAKEIEILEFLIWASKYNLFLSPRNHRLLCVSVVSMKAAYVLIKNFCNMFKCNVTF